MNKDHPLGRDFLELQRKTAKGYTCPACRVIFSAEPKLWDHGLRNHPEYLKGLEAVEKAEGGARKLFRQQALDQTQQSAVTIGKAGMGAADLPAHPRSSLDWSKNFGGSAIENTKAASPVRPEPAPGQSQDPQKRIEENIGDLTIGQEGSTEQDARPLSMSNPRKRGAEGGSSSPTAPDAGYTFEPTSTRPRHGDTLSGGRDPESARQEPPLDDTDYKRGVPMPKQPLWNPGSDSPNATKVGRRDKQHGQNTTSRRLYPRKEFYSVEQGQGLTETDTLYPQPESDHAKSLVPQPLGKPDEKRTYPHPPQAGWKSYKNDNPSGGRLPDHEDGPEDEPEMLLQPDTRPISHEQLVVEVKGIYAGLVMVEAKCIDIDERQIAAAQEKDPLKKPELKNDQWQSLIALHKQLLHEHHDFFLASQHPSASQNLSRLAAKYSMPARMWRHGIHAFLEVLRHRLPGSLEHMLAFIYIAYSMMALLYETVPAFEDTWIECLGDLGRYRMAIEEDDPRDREVWSNVAKFWYNKASDKTPEVGRLYHHLAILARPYTLEQLSLYTRSLTCVTPFESAKGSIMTLFNPVLGARSAPQRRSIDFETVFLRAHAIMFTSKPTDSDERLNATINELDSENLISGFIRRTGAKFKEAGVYVAISNIAALFEYGSTKIEGSNSRLRFAYDRAQTIEEEAKKSAATNANEALNLPPSTGPPQPELDTTEFGTNNTSSFIAHPSRLAFLTLSICLDHPDNSNVYPLVHVKLTFIWSLTKVLQTYKDFEQDTVLATIEKDIPWIRLCSFLNALAVDSQAMSSNVWRDEFPRPIKERGRPLPEDFMMRGQLYTRWYFVADWFAAFMADDDERLHDLPSMALPRKTRILWLGHGIASANRWIRFDRENARFATTEYVDGLLATIVEPKAVSDTQDITMSGSETTGNTSRATSLAATESLATSSITTRASTPTNTFDSDPVALPITPRAGDTVAASDDVPMMDISPGKDEQVYPFGESKSFNEGPTSPSVGHRDAADGDDSKEPQATEIRGGDSVGANTKP